MYQISIPGAWPEVKVDPRADPGTGIAHAVNQPGRHAHIYQPPADGVWRQTTAHGKHAGIYECKCKEFWWGAYCFSLSKNYICHFQHFYKKLF